MQQDTVGSASESSEDSGKSISFDTLLKSSELKKTLKDRSPHRLDKRLIEELASGKNVVVETETALTDCARCIFTALGDKALANSEKALVLVPSSKEISEIQEVFSDLSLGDSVILKSFEECGEADLSTVKTIAFMGFSAGSSLPGSEEFENFLNSVNEQEGAKEVQLCWCSESIPLTLNGAINRNIKVDDYKHINLEKESEVKLAHEFYEVGHELLAKPEALATLIEVEGRPKAAIFCNNPSETDLLEVMLKKAGIKARKLIGNVPDHAVRTVMEQVRNGDVEVVVLTDVSGQTFPVEEFDMVVHHAAPEDPETYLHRMGQPDRSSKLKRVVSLVGSTDLGNFHFLKKVLEFDFESKSLPSSEEVAKARFSSFQKQATEFSTEDSEINEYAKLIEDSGEQSAFLNFLLHQYLRVLPEASANKRDKRSRNSRDRYDRDGYDDDRSGGRGNRDERRDRDRDRDRNSRDRGPEKKPRPTRKDLRYYVGLGLNDKLTEEKFKALLDEAMGDEAPVIERSCIRQSYAFFDFQQKVSEPLYEAMKDAALDDKPLHFIQAAMLTVPLEEEEEGEETSEGAEKTVASPTEEVAEEAPAAEA